MIYVYKLYIYINLYSMNATYTNLCIAAQQYTRDKHYTHRVIEVHVNNSCNYVSVHITWISDTHVEIAIYTLHRAMTRGINTIVTIYTFFSTTYVTLWPSFLCHLCDFMVSLQCLLFLLCYRYVFRRQNCASRIVRSSSQTTKATQSCAPWFQGETSNRTHPRLLTHIKP